MKLSESRYCSELDGECFSGLCDNCEYKLEDLNKHKLKSDPQPHSNMKFYEVQYNADVILAMPEPCGVLVRNESKGNFFIWASDDDNAEERAEEIIENYFCIDHISELFVRQIDLEAIEKEAEATKDCEECSFMENGFCILEFSDYEEDYEALDLKEGD